MSRILLTSEIEILIESGATTPREELAVQTVWRELYVPSDQPRPRQWFNTDFVIELVDSDLQEQLQVNMVPVRPWALGGDYFVLLSSEGTPHKFELLEGESLPRSSFKEEVKRIDAVLTNLGHLAGCLSCQRAPYLRIARLSASVAFLISSTTAISEVLTAAPVYINSAEGLIEHRSAGGQLLIDGVLHDSGGDSGP